MTTLNSQCILQIDHNANETMCESVRTRTILGLVKYFNKQIENIIVLMIGGNKPTT